MLSKYFQIKTKEPEFKERLLSLSEKLKGKKVLLYGEKQVFEALEKSFSITKLFDSVGLILDIYKRSGKVNNLKIISRKDTKNAEYDVILSIQPCIPLWVSSYIIGELEIKDKEIEYLFKEEFQDETINLDLAYAHKLDKTLPKLVKKMQGKRVMLYGAGPFAALILKYFDFSGLDIIGIADRKYGSKPFDMSREVVTETFMGYKTFAPDKIAEAKPDCVLITTISYINILEDLYFNVLKGTNIKILPVIKKPLSLLIREIWYLS